MSLSILPTIYLTRDTFQTISQEWEIQAEYSGFAEIKGQRLDFGKAEEVCSVEESTRKKSYVKKELHKFS